MATSKTLELSIKIAGRMDKSLTAAINGTQSKIGSLTKSISNIGTVGLATMGAVATAAAVGIADCTKEAQALESSMAPVVRYVDGLDRDFGIDISTTDYPQESAQALLAAEYVRKTKMYEPRARVVRVEWTDSKAHDGNMTPKVVIDLV